MLKEKHQNLQQLDGTSCADCSLQWNMHISHILPPDPCESPTEVLMVKPGVMKWSSHQMRWREYASQGGERSWFWPFYWCASSGLCVCVFVPVGLRFQNGGRSVCSFRRFSLQMLSSSLMSQICEWKDAQKRKCYCASSWQPGFRSAVLE